MKLLIRLGFVSMMLLMLARGPRMTTAFVVHQRTFRPSTVSSLQGSMFSSTSRDRRITMQSFGIQRLSSSARPETRRFLSTEASSSTSPIINDQLDDQIDSDINLQSNYDFDNDTIFALSSGSSMGQATAVAVIRITGPLASSVLQSLTTKPLPKPRLAVVRDLVHPTTCVPLDQALVLWFPGPNSFTGQDIVELHCHGSRAVVESVLQALSEWNVISPSTSDNEESQSSQNHVRLAEPGEFTKRAWQSGKLNLLQVEALADLLVADTSTQRVQALRQLEQSKDPNSNVFEQWRRQLIGGLAHAEAVIDFGDDENLGDDDDEGADDLSDDNSQTAQWTIWGNVRNQMQDLCQSMEQHLYNDGRRGELVRNGVRIAIIGPPNAGKSSLLNLLAQREAAIVSPMAGTTRDVVEVALNLGGVKCLVQDTAGLRRHTEDVIEQKGMERATQVAAEADMVLVMMDGSDATSDANAAEDGTGDDDEMKWLMQSVLSSIVPNVSGTAMEGDDTSEAETQKQRSTGPEVFLVVNKSDLKEANGESPLMRTDKSAADASNTMLTHIPQQFEISCVTQSGVDSFLESLTRKVLARVSAPDDDDTSLGGRGNLITRTRHRKHVQAAAEALRRFDDLSAQGTYAVDMAAEELRLAASELGRVTGAVDVEDVLDKLFSDFCIGK